MAGLGEVVEGEVPVAPEGGVPVAPDGDVPVPPDGDVPVPPAGGEPAGGVLGDSRGLHALASADSTSVAAQAMVVIRMAKLPKVARSGRWRCAVACGVPTPRRGGARGGMCIAAPAWLRIVRASPNAEGDFMRGWIPWTALPACAALLAAAPALAQTQTSSPSWVPYTTNGYVGLNVGLPEYKLPCTPGFPCDDPDASFHIYTGGSYNELFGFEFGYLYMGEADRQGGTTRGHGLNLSLVGSFPVAQSFKVFGKIGTTYGRTTVSASPAANEPTGDEDGFGWSYGFGAQYDWTPQWSLVAQWDRHEMKFAGRGRQDVDALSLGAKFKF